MKNNSLTLLFHCLFICLLIAFSNIAFADFEKVKTKTFSGEKFLFPQDIKGTPLSLLFLAMSSDRDNGQLQQKQLIEWHTVLEERNILNQNINSYHFPVMKSPPFFVKGIIRNAMAEVYEGTTALDQAGVLYVKNLAKFANQAGLTLDEKPTLVLLNDQGKILGEIKGSVSEDTIQQLTVLITLSKDE